MTLRVIVFNVEHGFCAFLKTPTNHTMLIDCGRAADFSPARYIAENELDDAAGYGDKKLTWMTITHPHDDHIEDIENIKKLCPPGIICRQRYDWDDIKQSSDGDYANLESYAEWQQAYNVNLPDPDFGMTLQRFCLTPAEATNVDQAKYVNNSSIVTVATFNGTQFTEKFLFAGDIEEAGWKELLKNTNFKAAVKNVHFYIAPHHGHTSGFSTALFEAFEKKPIVNIVSVHSRDEHVDCRYSQEAYASGQRLDGDVRRRMVSTRADGSIFIEVGAEGRYSLWTQKLEPNEKKKAATPWWWE